MHLYRRKDDRRALGPWWLEVQIRGRRYRRSLRVFSKDAAVLKARAVIDELELAASGVVPRSRLQHTCRDLVALYRANQERAGRDAYNLAQACRWLERTLPLATPAAIVNGAELLKRIDAIEALSSRRRTYEYVRALFNWGVSAKLLDAHPLAGLAGPKKVRVWQRRRAFMFEEFVRLLAAVDFERGLVYMVGARTGLRNREIRLLERRDLDTVRWSITVREEVSKTREEVVLAIPGDLRTWIEAQLVARGELAPHDRLFLKVPKKAASLYADLEKAGIAKTTPDGRLDFHALRTSHVSWVTDSGASLAQVQAVGRLKTASLATEVYARFRLEQDRATLDRATPGGLLSHVLRAARAADRMETSNCQ